MKFIAMILSGLVSTAVFANSENPVRDRVAKFLEGNVIGRTQEIATEGTLAVEGETVKVDFKAKITWSGLRLTSDGLVFDEHRDIKQTNTKIDGQGNPIGAPVVTDRQVTHHYAVGERRTTRSLVGLTTVSLDTTDAVTGEGYTTMMDMSEDGKELYIYQSMAGFVERSLDGITDIPVSLATSASLYLDQNGKLILDQTVKFYKVDINNDFAREEINRFNLSATEVSR